ncbi:superoxide dismutase family protein [Sphingomonas sp. 37zxx]|uniref:superoxide dismutase family protein n=1 Tax=Sphingomonas sp. 37zxx TaxID=1550073 RepID=UPI000B11EF25|nr:superoxide dismutase family protein [Sphingomonas sp. 37zxx]
MMKFMMLTAMGALALALGGCAMNGASSGTAGEGAGATAQLITANGQMVGTATATQTTGGLELTVNGKMMPPGPHGAHVHTIGRCDAPAFETAGGHWNPTGKQHGMQNPAGPHVGDAPNLDVASDGSGKLTYILAGATMAGLLEGDGSSMMIHAGPDDMKTDPSGNSGGRIACGVFRAE